MSSHGTNHYRAPVLRMLDGAIGPVCRLCDNRAVLVCRPSGFSTDAYHYCASCVNDALERYDMEH